MTSGEIILSQKIDRIRQQILDAEAFAESEGLNFSIETASGSLRHESTWEASWSSSND